MSADPERVDRVQPISNSATAIRLLVKFLRVLLVGIGGLFVLVAGVVALGIYLNDRAEADATALCARIAPGITEEAALALANGTRARDFSSTGKHEFRFQGWVFNATSCEVSIEDGKVAKAAVVALGD